MRQMSATPSVTPNAGSTVYIVLDDFGKLGASCRETDTTYCDRGSVIDDLLHGQFTIRFAWSRSIPSRDGRPTRPKTSRMP
jgi:hypothetical protein